MVLTQKQQAELFALANGNYSDAANSSVIVVNSPLYLDGKLITDNVTKHQYNDVMAKRYKDDGLFKQNSPPGYPR